MKIKLLTKQAKTNNYCRNDSIVLHSLKQVICLYLLALARLLDLT